MARISTLFGDVSIAGTSLFLHLCLSNSCLSSFVDWPSLFLMFSCYANYIVCSYTLPYGVAHFSNRFCAKQYSGTTLSFSLSSANLLTISTFLLLICITHADPFAIVLSFHRFATSIFILTSNFPPNSNLVGARERLEIDNFKLVLLLPKLTFTACVCKPFCLQNAIVSPWTNLSPTLFYHKGRFFVKPCSYPPIPTLF